MNKPSDARPEPRVRTARPDDLPAIAALHRSQFPDHFLGRYPHSIVAAFYRSFMPESIFLVAEFDGHLVGFVVGGDATVLRRCRQDFTRRKWLPLALATAARPGLWAQAYRRLSMLGGGRREQPGFRSLATWRLLSIAVSDAAKGRGVAGVLVDSFERNLTDVSCYGLSVHDDNQRAVGFYRKVGFEEEGARGGGVYFVKHMNTVKGDTEPARDEPDNVSP